MYNGIMIRVTPSIAIDESEIRMDFVRSSGPGGQNVNKVSTAVQLRFDAASSPSLPDEVRRRLLLLAGNRATKEGELLIEARRFRTQGQNRRDAVDRLVALIRQAAARPKKRIRTRPSTAARKRRLEEKRRHGAIKHQRQSAMRPED